MFIILAFILSISNVHSQEMERKCYSLTGQDSNDPTSVCANITKLSNGAFFSSVEVFNGNTLIDSMTLESNAKNLSYRGVFIGTPVQYVGTGTRYKFYIELWAIDSDITRNVLNVYGRVLSDGRIIKSPQFNYKAKPEPRGCNGMGRCI